MRKIVLIGVLMAVGVPCANASQAVFANGRSIAGQTDASGTTVAFPDIGKTPVPVPGGPIPIPYPNTATVPDASKGTRQAKIAPPTFRMPSRSNLSVQPIPDRGHVLNRGSHRGKTTYTRTTSTRIYSQQIESALPSSQTPLLRSLSR